MKDSADLTIRHSQAPRPRGGGLDVPARRRFSPLNAQQRATVDAFCTESRAWALRQAARTYRHLPEELREQAVDSAVRELRTGAPVSVDRRTLHAELALELTAALRRVHIGWCLNQSAAVFRGDGIAAPPAAPDGEALAAFVDEGLGGLERAVLQLEIGAGRDTRTARAALRLGPRQYSRHREAGLSKLRDAITGTVAGHVCDDHVGAVVLAATGDRAAAEALAGGATRCRACSREAQGLRRLLHERLALAPWPFVVKPAGMLAAKAVALTAAISGKGAGGLAAGFGGGSVGSGAGVVATVLAAAAVATGGAAAIGHDSPRAPSAAANAAPPSVLPATARTAATPASRATAAKPAAKARHGTSTRHRAATHRTRAADHRTTSTAPTTSTTTTTTGGTAPAATATPNSVVDTTTQAVKNTTHDAVDKVQQTVDRVTQPVAPQVAQPVNTVVDQAQGAVDQLGNTVGGLLPPPK
ncbi:MAG: hypothetical protein QOE86_4274 [Solirubrobacteraceae bacterium]|nr:hypothetical protein [Solirubrobacteraceae bacterium]